MWFALEILWENLCFTISRSRQIGVILGIIWQTGVILVIVTHYMFLVGFSTRLNIPAFYNNVCLLHSFSWLQLM